MVKAPLIAVFNNMQTLKFKPQLTVYVFRCRQSSKQTSWETEAHFSRVKRSCLSVVIGRFQSILFVSVFQDSLAVAINMVDDSEKPNRQLDFELQSLHLIENHNKIHDPSSLVLFASFIFVLTILLGDVLHLGIL